MSRFRLWASLGMTLGVVAGLQAQELSPELRQIGIEVEHRRTPEVGETIKSLTLSETLDLALEQNVDLALARAEGDVVFRRRNPLRSAAWL